MMLIFCALVSWTTVRMNNGMKCLFSVRNKVSPSDNDRLKLLRTDWCENLSDKFTLKQIVKTTVSPEKPWFDLTGFKTYFENWFMGPISDKYWSICISYKFCAPIANACDSQCCNSSSYWLCKMCVCVRVYICVCGKEIGNRYNSGWKELSQKQK